MIERNTIRRKGERGVREKERGKRERERKWVCEWTACARERKQKGLTKPIKIVIERNKNETTERTKKIKKENNHKKIINFK